MESRALKNKPGKGRIIIIKYTERLVLQDYKLGEKWKTMELGEKWKTKMVIMFCLVGVCFCVLETIKAILQVELGQALSLL